MLRNQETGYKRVWDILIACAKRGEQITYSELGSKIDMPFDPQGVADYIIPVEGYCQEKNLPLLSALVVRKDTGKPGTGFNSNTPMNDEQYKDCLNRVFNMDWHTIENPFCSKKEGK